MNGLHGFGAGIKFVNGLYQANDIRSVNALQRHRGKAICNLLLILAELPPAKKIQIDVSLRTYIFLSILTTDACKCAAGVYKVSADQYHRAYQSD